MAIEGPLRELGIHDVFQLLDLSRKTGALRVTSELRDNEGTVLLRPRPVVYAAIRSNPHPLGELLLRGGQDHARPISRARATRSARRSRSAKLGELLVESGAITQRELERQVRFQVEEVVFELMSWREGFFSFEEQRRERRAGGGEHPHLHRVAAHGGRAAHRRVVAHRRQGRAPGRGARARARSPRIIRGAARPAARASGRCCRDRRRARPARHRDDARPERVRCRAGRVRAARPPESWSCATASIRRRPTAMARRPRHRPPSLRSRPPQRRCTRASRRWRSRSAQRITTDRRSSRKDICCSHACSLGSAGRATRRSRSRAGCEADPLNAELHARSGYCAAWCGDFLDALASLGALAATRIPAAPTHGAFARRAMRRAACARLLQEHIDV